ncbi:SLC13 family permease [Sinorhizobium meliloti]|jgi:di/tricarboxylate transporter|uniref:SLC13 family permease n=1 Tax=Rhizobium meliloti TaxID=382 RepID=A0A2J0YXG8_RHIML|nr:MULTISPECIES: SLC13 family permease [Sinorhizobium]PND22203.1 SLC13 family permease [Ensifer sp. MMN_5]GCA52397.1 potassium transporter peripheral membrane component [Sinorhizobium sp. KGO-5]MCG5486725.1 anion permease [Sinorhizobium meliloti]PJR12953.1 SLC13 family permease [Sinorhizobium meliloti]PND29116.1 SLC13 family permease [Sinorhizobium sp. M4_45]
MTAEQTLSFLVLGAMMIFFIWGRFRYDIIACSALMLSVAVGIVPFDNAFDGFSDDIVIIVGSALIVSAGVARSGVVDAAIQRFLPDLQSVRAQLALLVVTVTVLSAFIKNIGALAIMIPVAFQFARRSNVQPSVFLMPMAFGSLIGGLMTQVGTSPNVVVSRVRADLTGESFTMFDFTPVGASLALVGAVFLLFGYRLVPERKSQQVGMHQAIEITDYTSEAMVPAGSPVIGKPLSNLVKIGDGGAVVIAVFRRGTHLAPLPDVVVELDDILLLEGGPAALDRIVSQAKLKISGDRAPMPNDKEKAETEAIEAVIATGSPLIGMSAQRLALFNNHNINLLAVSRQGERLKQRLGSIRLRAGDIVVLQGTRRDLPSFLQDFGCLPLAQREILLGTIRRATVPLLVLATAMGATAVGVVPVQIAFFAAALAMVVFRVIPLRDVYRAVDGPILVMLAALIPVSDTLRTTGGSDLIAGWLSGMAVNLPPAGALAIMVVAAMAVTPFLNNAATVLVMAPIAASFATALEYRPDAFLMAVAIGAGSDFLTPIGHQCNTLVMGPGGYRFSDYPRLGLPLSIVIVIVAVPMLMWIWPLR